MITGSEARELGRKIVFENPAGIGPTEIGKKILALHPDMADAKGKPNGNIRGAVWKLDKDFPDIEKTANGFAPKSGGACVIADPKSTGREAAGIDSGTGGIRGRKVVPERSPRTRRFASETLRQREEAAETSLRATLEREAQEGRLRISALEDAIGRAHTELEELKARSDGLKQERDTLASEMRLAQKEIRAYQLSVMGELEPDLVSPVKIQGIVARLKDAAEKRRTESIGVLDEAKNAAVLIDIRQAVLAGSEEGTLEAVQRVVTDLGKVRTQLSLTGIRDDAKRLKAARKAAGVTQRALGTELGFSGRSVIDLIERGMTTLAKHADVLRWVQKVEAKHAQDGV